MRTPLAAKAIAKNQIKDFGWDYRQWTCLHRLWTKESNWRPNALNRQPVKVLKNGKWIKVHAGGIPQILGMNPKLNIVQQLDRGMTYIERRYSTPCQALKFHNRYNYY